jgi:hypothetical protein
MKEPGAHEKDASPRGDVLPGLQVTPGAHAAQALAPAAAA